jgi:hypothetical protein
MAEDYITLAELASSLSLTETFADDDLEAAITAASREVDRRTQRFFWSEVGTRYYTPSSAGLLWVDDLASFGSVSIDVARDNTFTESWTLNTDFVLEPLNASAEGRPYTTIRVIERSGRYFPVGEERTVRVTGTFGWAAVPATIKQATSILASRLVKRVREAPFGVAGFGIDGGAVRVPSFDPDVDALLAGYVRTNHAL